MLNLVLFGPPGAGKGTQSKLLIKKYDLLHISTGDVLRNEILQKTKLGLKAKEYMNKGLLVPDKIVIDMIKNILQDNKDKNGFIFDGFPRTKSQAVELDRVLNSLNTKIKAMISLEIDDNELIKRILLRGKDSGRDDDKDESIIKNRIQEYHTKTSPLKTYYSDQNKLYNIEGIGNVDNIFNNLCLIIDKL